jgi:hypothetical protein
MWLRLRPEGLKAQGSAQRLQVWVLTGLLAILFPLPTWTGLAEGTEASLKLAFVYNFAKFADWPARSNPAAAREVDICVYPVDPEYEAAWGSLSGQSVQGMALHLRSISRPAEVVGCQVVFAVGRASQENSDLARAAVTSGVLSVGEGATFLRSGGMIGLDAGGNRILFDVNLNAVQAAGISLNAQVLKLARSVR